MKTLADFKRRLTVGTKVLVTNYNSRIVHGNTGTTTLPLKPWQKAVEVDGKPAVQWEAVVAQNQATQAVFKVGGTENLSYLKWPKASCFKLENDKAAIYWEDGKPCLTYEFLS